MQFRLDPLAPNGLAVVVETKPQRGGHGFIASPDITRVLQAGTNVTLTGQGTTQSPYVVNATGGGGTSGITRSVSSISSPTTAGTTAATDYVYLVSGTTTLTLPTAVGNTNRYTVTNTGSNIVTVATTGGQTINGSSSATLPIANMSLDFISDNANWYVE